MNIFAYDRKGQHGFVPNLVERTDILPKSQEWWDLCITPPYSYEFRFLRYLEVEKIPYTEILVDEITAEHGKVIYPINLNFFDPTIDYLALVSNKAKELCRLGQLNIVIYYSEGDNVNREIDDRLNKMAAEHSIPMDGIRFVIANKNFNKNPYCYFPDDELYYRYLHLKGDYVKQVNTQERSKKFTCLNRMDKPFRKLFAASLWYHGLTNDAYFSYTGMRYQKEYLETVKDPVYKWDKWWNETGLLFNNFDMHVPFTCDALTDAEHNNHKLIDKKFYSDAYWNFVVETHFNKHNLFLTEKTFKPILNMQPFIIVGAPGSLKLLRELGYETFGEWIDESYDKIKNDEERMHVCFEIAYELASMSHSEHITMMKEMIPVLAHNQQVFLESKKHRCEKLLERMK